MPENPRIDDLRRRLEREPGSRVFAQLAEELRKAGQLAEAVRVARQGLLNHPGYPSARMTLGRALMDMRDLRGARAEFEAVLRGAPENILASRYLGECLEGLGDLGSALLQFRATLRLAPGDRNLEAQIRALEQRLTPTGTAPPPAPPAATPRPPLLPREGAIPVLDVEEPMELESPFDKTTPWRPTPVPPPAPPTIHPEPPPPPAPRPFASVGEREREPTPAAVHAAPAEPVSPPEQFFEAEPLEAGPPPAAERPEPTVPGATGAAEPLNESFPEEWDLQEPPPPPAASPAPPPAGSDAPALSSSTLAELYFNQGFTRQAIDVYRELLEREPGNERIRARIVELEAIERGVAALDREGGAPIAAPSVAPGDSKARRRQAIERTIERLEGFLATVRRA